MAIQTRFVLAAAAFCALLASGAFTLAAIASPWPEASSGAASLVEHAALPPPADERLRPDLLGEQSLDGVGSAPEPEAETVAGVDPWADAFAESSRLAAAPVPKPAYPVDVNPQVQYFLDRFTGARREVVGLWVGRAGRYLGMIREVLRSRGLPEELAYVAMIESGFNPTAVSRAGAKGLWQFMAGTARRYGLRVDPWIDERFDPTKSTIAAAAYLRDLHVQFGSWTLAQAAYNAGEMKVTRAIKLTGSSDFWMLARTNHLRRETKDFVPAIHAATLISLDPARYGFAFPDGETPAVETVAVPASTDLRGLALRAGIGAETLRNLNPVLVRAVTPPGVPWPIAVPAGTRDDVLSALAPAPARTVTARTDGDIHVVRPKDTVSAIAKRYGVSVSDVLRWNRLAEQSRIRPGDRLRIADVRPSVEPDGQGGFR